MRVCEEREVVLSVLNGRGNSTCTLGAVCGGVGILFAQNVIMKWMNEGISVPHKRGDQVQQPAMDPVFELINRS